MRAWCVLAALAGCGDNHVPAAGFEIVGHADLGARGMNSALAVVGTTVFVGSRIDNRPIEIVDVSDPSEPAVVGEIPGVPVMSPRELRAFDSTLVVLSLRCDPALHGCANGAGEPEAIKLYDIRNRRLPRLVATYPVVGSQLVGKSPHEMYLRRANSKTLLFIAEPPAIIEVVDITDPTMPTRVVSWNPKIPSQGNDDIIHSVSVSADGTRLFLSHQLSGLFVADATALPTLTLMTPANAGLDFSPPGTVGPHSTVEVPGRNLVVITEEVYPPPYGTGCPWGVARIADVSDPTAPALISTFGLPQNDPAFCTEAFDRVSFTSHNTTATQNLALVTWHAAGLQAIDIADAVHPQFVAELRPDPLPSVTTEDPGLGGAPIEMWSYPVIQDGLIYVIDVRNGLYILRYHGPWEEQISEEAFLEGNSNR